LLSLRQDTRDIAGGVVTLTFLSQNTEVFKNACCWISTTYETSIPIKKPKPADY
jgi:hypothetical protein